MTGATPAPTTTTKGGAYVGIDNFFQRGPFGPGPIGDRKEHTTELQSQSMISYAVFCLEEHTSELQSQSMIAYAVFCLKRGGGGGGGGGSQRR